MFLPGVSPVDLESLRLGLLGCGVLDYIGIIFENFNFNPTVRMPIIARDFSLLAFLPFWESGCNG
jgi:hypothetical protein